MAFHLIACKMRHTGFDVFVERGGQLLDRLWRFLQQGDDLPLARTTHAYFVRSPHAHARIKSVDISAAKAMPGVVEIFTGKDVADAKIGSLICGWVVKDKHGEPHKSPPHPVLAHDVVRYVGDPVAMVVANSHEEAKDAAEAIRVDYEVLPANVDLARSFDAGVPQIWEQLEARGLRVGAFSPMNAGNALRDAAFFVPDPWTRTRVQAPALMRSILDAIDAAVSQGRRVYVHCRAGIGRTGTVVGCYLVRHGMSGPQAIAQISLWRAATPDLRGGPG